MVGVGDSNSLATTTFLNLFNYKFALVPDGCYDWSRWFEFTCDQYIPKLIYSMSSLCLWRRLWLGSVISIFRLGILIPFLKNNNTKTLILIRFSALKKSRIAISILALIQKQKSFFLMPPWGVQTLALSLQSLLLD